MCRIVGLTTVRQFLLPFRMLPLLIKLYFQDLHVSPPQYNTALALYFVAYVAFEVPANVSPFNRATI
jgi:hypothetical protein